MKLLITLLMCAVAVACGYGSKSVMPAIPAATPTITQLNPNAVTAGSGSFSLEVDGSTFASNAVINFNNTAETTSVVSGTKLTTTIPASAVVNAGTVPVTVTNPGTSGGLYGGGTTTVTSTAMNFSIN